MDGLTELGTRYGTDKAVHGFCAFYDEQFGDESRSFEKIMEIGVHRGSSLYMWREYCPKAQIHGLDAVKTNIPATERITVYEGDQADRRDLQALLDAAGSNFDLIMDDGGHTMEQQQVSFGFLFPHVRPGGIYVIEDLHTSFMERIPLFKGGKMVVSYLTGVGPGVWTSCQMVEALARGEPARSDFMLPEERAYLDRYIESAALFDRDGNHQHMTSVIRKRN